MKEKKIHLWYSL